MPTPQRRDSTGLIDQLLADPHRFQFFQAVRLLERALARPNAPAGQVLPRELRFRNSLSLAFPSSEIEALQVEHAQGKAAPPGTITRIDITPSFMGLLGMMGALPFVYTEQIAHREFYNRDHAARAFLDVFSNRAVALFYASWKKSRLALQYEADRRNRFAPLVLALAGIGQKPLRDRLQAQAGGVGDESLAFFAGALHQRALSAQQLQRLLSRYLGVPVHIEQFCGRWYTLPESARTSLGLGNGLLGQNALAGSRVWQRDLRVKVLVGPLKQHDFQRFLPGAPAAVALRELLTLLSGTSLEYEVNLTLRADAVQPTALGSGRPAHAGRLGWDTYMQTRPTAQDRCDVRYDALAASA